MKKRKHICLVLLLCSLLIALAGCGGKGEQQESGNMGEEPLETKELVISTGTSRSDIFSETEELFRHEGKEGEWECEFLNMQFYKGEPVQLWLVMADSEGTPLSLFMYEVPTYINGEYQGMVPGLHPIYEGVEVVDGKFRPKLQLYLFRADGTRELLIEDLLANDHHMSYGENEWSAAVRANDYYFASGWYMDRDGACYCWWNDRGVKDGNNGEYTFMKIEPSGEMAYDVLLEDGIQIKHMFQLPDGRMLLILRDNIQNVIRIAEFDPDTGKLDGTDVVVRNPWRPGENILPSYYCSFGTDEEGNLYLKSSYASESGIYKLDLSDGSASEAVSFNGTTYTIWNSIMEDSAINLKSGFTEAGFRVLSDGSAEVLWYTGYSWRLGNDAVIQGLRETLHPVSADRPTVTIRAEAFSAWMKQQAALFNRKNPRWQVVLEEYASSNAVDLEEYARLTSVQIATGKGPDMLCGNFMDSYVPGMLEKGSLLELSGLLQESGVREEDYLPFTFDVWRMGESVYGVTTESGTPQLYTIDSRVLGGEEEPDMETLVQALQAWEEDSALLGYDGPSENLRGFLRGSEDLWGMVDWEKGTCDFSGDLFKGLLEVSKRHGYEENRQKPNLVRTIGLSSIYTYMGREGRTVCGILYDDGCHGTVNGDRTLMVNAASGSKEGALEFLCFLLGENAQKKIPSNSIPARRELLEAWVRRQVERTAGGAEIGGDVSYIDGGEFVKDVRTYTEEDMTEERIQEYLAALEDVRALIARNQPIIDIICEEAEYYFNGDKSVKEIVKVINSKVWLYLAERQ